MSNVVDTSSSLSFDGKREPAKLASAPREFDEYELAVSTLIGGFFTGLSLADLSVDLHAEWGTDGSTAGIRAGYLQWKSAAPILSSMVLVLAIPLPFVFYKFIREEIIPLVGLNVEKPLSSAERWLRTLGTAVLCLIVTAVLTVAAGVMPNEAACAGGDQAGCQELWWWHAVVVFLNIVLLVMPFFRYQAARVVEQLGKER
jgi:hypothetical protein